MSEGPMWPDIQDLQFLHPLPRRLVARLDERYRGLSDAYRTNILLKNGRPVNACMEKDSLKDAEEEVVDAIFNLLVYRLKVKQELLKDAPVSDEALQGISIDLLEAATALWSQISDWIE